MGSWSRRKGACGVIKLREIERDDVPIIHSWRSDRDVVATLTGAFRHVNREVDDAWFDRYLTSRDREVRLGVLLGESNSLIGVVYLLSIDWVNSSAQYGLMIGAREQWAKGYGTEATRLAIAHAFDDLNLNRLWLDVFEDHEPAIRIYEKCGFVREGVARNAVYKDGRYRSLVLMGLLKSERVSADGR